MYIVSIPVEEEKVYWNINEQYSKTGQNSMFEVDQSDCNFPH